MALINNHNETVSTPLSVVLSMATISFVISALFWNKFINFRLEYLTDLLILIIVTLLLSLFIVSDILLLVYTLILLVYEAQLDKSNLQYFRQKLNIFYLRLVDFFVAVSIASIIIIGFVAVIMILQVSLDKILFQEQPWTLRKFILALCILIILTIVLVYYLHHLFSNKIKSHWLFSTVFIINRESISNPIEDSTKDNIKVSILFLFIFFFLIVAPIYLEFPNFVNIEMTKTVYSKDDKFIMANIKLRGLLCNSDIRVDLSQKHDQPLPLKALSGAAVIKLRTGDFICVRGIDDLHPGTYQLVINISFPARPMDYSSKFPNTIDPPKPFFKWTVTRNESFVVL